MKGGYKDRVDVPRCGSPAEAEGLPKTRSEVRTELSQAAFCRRGPGVRAEPDDRLPGWQFRLVDGGVNETRTRKAAAQRGSDDRRERAAKREKFGTLKDASNPIDQRPSAVRPALAGLNDAPANGASRCERLQRFDHGLHPRQRMRLPSQLTPALRSRSRSATAPRAPSSSREAP